MAEVKAMSGADRSVPYNTGSSFKDHCAFFRTVPHPDKLTIAQRLNPIVKQLVYPEVSDGAYGIPHIQDKPSLGVSMSGGGFRATTCASGWLRGLHNIQVEGGGSALSKARYLATTSGGSWCNAAFSYEAKEAGDLPAKEASFEDRHDAVEKFCGRYIEAGGLKPELIKELPQKGSYAYHVAEHNALDELMRDMRNEWLKTNAMRIIGYVVDAPRRLVTFAKSTVGRAVEGKKDDQYELDKQPHAVKPWTVAITNAFLAPFHLNLYQHSTVSAHGTNGHIAESHAAANADHVMLACADPDKPFPIMMGAAFNPHGEDGLNFYPFEFTPLYWGTPTIFSQSDPPLGGGYVEPWGLHAQPKGPPSTTCVGNACECEIGDFEVCRDHDHKHEHMVPLPQAVGISSSFLAAGAHNLPHFVRHHLASTEELTNYGLCGKEGDKPKCGEMSFADGGTIDNLGISALLRRGVSCMIVCVASSSPPDMDWETWAEDACDVACWFGCARDFWVPGVTAGELNDMCHVFGANQLEGERLFRELFEAVHTNLRNGQPPFYRGTYHVRQNNFHNIAARDKDVEVLWIFNHQWADWEERLPPETLKQLNRERKGPDSKGKGVHHTGWPLERQPLDGELLQGPEGLFRQTDLFRFPYFTTYSLDFSNAATNMLSQQCTAVMLSDPVQEEVQKLVKKASERAAEGTPAGAAAVAPTVARAPVSKAA